jgi:hypothetical protein
MGNLLLQSNAIWVEECWFNLSERAMTTLFHDMMHREIEVYVDYMIAKSLDAEDHLNKMRNKNERLRK